MKRQKITSQVAAWRNIELLANVVPVEVDCTGLAGNFLSDILGLVAMPDQLGDFDLCWGQLFEYLHQTVGLCGGPVR